VQLRDIDKKEKIKKAYHSTKHEVSLNEISERDNIKRILIIKLRHFGDILLLTPLLNTLKINYRNALINVLVYKGTEEILSANDVIHHAYVVDRALKHQGLKKQIKGEKALLRSLKEEKYQLIINLSDQWRAAIYCRLLKPTYSIGLHFPKRENRWWQYCHSALVNVPHFSEQHTVLNNLAILKPLHLPLVNSDVVMAYDNDAALIVAQLRQSRNFGQYVLFQPTARWHFKTWSTHGCSQVINHLIAQGETVVLTSGPDRQEHDYITQIIATCDRPDAVINLSGQLTVTQLAALIDQAILFIGVDSMAMHMAAALQTPSVVLFGPTNLKQWHPWQARHTLVWAGDYRTLPLPEEIDTNTKERYLDAIPVNVVLEAIYAQLASSDNQPSE
jgi:heptosyltransferase-3